MAGTARHGQVYPAHPERSDPVEDITAKYSMLTLLPVIYFLFSALLVLLLRRLQRGTGYSWLVGIVLSLVGWGGFLALHWINLPAFAATPWRPFEPQSADQIVFIWDEVSWSFGFALISLVVCLLFTAPARFGQRSSPLTWSANLMITALGLLAVMAATPMATVLAWTMLDILEVFLVLRLLQDRQHSTQTVIAFGARVAGTLVLLWAMIQTQALSQPLSYANLQPPFGVYLLIAAGLRLGVLPLNMPYISVLPLQRGLTNMLRMTAQASSLVIVARMAIESIPDVWIAILLPITSIGAFYGAAMWATAKNDLDGRRYWSLAVAGLSVASLLQGNQQAALVWGQVLIISGGILFFYSIRSRALVFLPALGLVGMLGLPFTPAANGLGGLAAAPFQFWDVLLIVNHALLIAGYVRLSLQPVEPPGELERWVFGVYPFGLLLLAVSGWLIAILTFTGLSIGVWWVSAVVVILAGAGIWLLAIRKPTSGEVKAPLSRGVEIINRVGSIFSPVFRLGWFYRLLWILFGVLQRILEVITRVLEGEGGVLWAILLVALLLTVLSGGGFLR